MPTSRLSKTFESTWGNPHYINTDPTQPLCLLTSFPQFSTVKYCLATRLQHTAYVERVTHWGCWRRYLFQTTTTLAPQGISSPSCSQIHWLTMLETASRQLCPGSAFKVLPYFLWRSDSGSLVGLLKHFYDQMRHARFSRSLKKKALELKSQPRDCHLQTSHHRLSHSPHWVRTAHQRHHTFHLQYVRTLCEFLSILNHL